jgi:hypothetical protein
MDNARILNLIVTLCVIFFLFFDINNLAKILQEINKIAEIYTKKSHFPTNFPFVFPINDKMWWKLH